MTSAYRRRRARRKLKAHDRGENRHHKGLAHILKQRRQSIENQRIGWKRDSPVERGQDSQVSTSSRAGLWPRGSDYSHVGDSKSAGPLCHCGEPVIYWFEGDKGRHRGMCDHCDSVRCDAYPGACGR